MSLLPLLVAALMLGVLVVLGLGIFNMTKSGEEAERRSGRLMSWRVALQAGAILLLGLLMVMTKR